MTAYSAPMACPRCSTRTLHAVDTDAGPTLDFCSDCGGVWFDAGELLSFLSWKKEPERIERAGELVACPRCQANTLSGFSFSADGPLLDGCGQCNGIWCDQGEVGALKTLSPSARTAKVEGKLIPLLETKGARGVQIDWKWVLGGFFLMLAMLGLASIVINLSIASDALSETTSSSSPDRMMAIGGALAFAVSGFIVGWRSSAHTLIEPAIVAIPAAMMFPFFFTASVTTGELLAASAAAFVITMAAAVAGEHV